MISWFALFFWECHDTIFFDEEIEFNCKNILDNVSLPDEKLLEETNQMVEEADCQILRS